MSEDDFALRAAGRAAWPGRKTTLKASFDEEDLSDSTTVEERLGMMWELARSAWSLTGAPSPEYSRSQMPGRLVRPADR